MKSIIDIFKMEELSKEVRIKIIKELGIIINYQYSANVTDLLVRESWCVF